MVVNHSINLLAEGKISYTDGGIFAEFAWVIVVLPFLAALLITFFGKNLPLKGAEIALGSVFFIFLYSCILFYLNVPQGVASEFFINVGSIGSFPVSYTHLTLPTILLV